MTKRSFTIAWLQILPALLMLYACQPVADMPDGGQTNNNQPDTSTTKKPDTKKPDTKKPDPTAAVFDPGTILKVTIQIDPADWDDLRTQTRNYDNILSPDCLSKPFASSFTYKKATVTINGTVLKNVGVRKKGFVGSIDDTKPSLKIKFDSFVSDQEYSGLDRLTLNNNRSDPSQIRQCLTYNLFRKAGMPAPRCNLAHVTINGQNYGVFTNVEHVGKRFLAQHFDDNDGRLYEGTLSDFRPDWVATFDAKTNEDDPDRSDLDAMVEALKLPDDGLLAALRKQMDIDRFFSFWAMEVLVNHLDGYAGNTNNFFIYRDPKTGLFSFIPWGVDATLLNRSWTEQGKPPVVLAKGILARRLYLLPEAQRTYVATLRTLLDVVWKEQDILQEIDRMEKLVAPVAANEPFLQSHFKQGRTFAMLVDQVREFVRNRRAQLKPALDNPPTWDQPLSDKICLKIDSDITGHFTTTSGTLGTPNPFSTGSGSFGGTVKGTTVTASNVGATAGIEAKDPNQVVVQVVAQVNQTMFVVAVFSIDKDDFVTGKPIQLRGMFARGKSGLVMFDSATQLSYLIGNLWSGTMLLSKAGLTKGESVAGTFSAKFIAHNDPAFVCYTECSKTGKPTAECKKRVDTFRACVQGGDTLQSCVTVCVK